MKRRGILVVVAMTAGSLVSVPVLIESPAGAQTPLPVEMAAFGSGTAVCAATSSTGGELQATNLKSSGSVTQDYPLRHAAFPWGGGDLTVEIDGFFSVDYQGGEPPDNPDLSYEFGITLRHEFASQQLVDKQGRVTPESPLETRVWVASEPDTPVTGSLTYTGLPAGMYWLELKGENTIGHPLASFEGTFTASGSGGVNVSCADFVTMIFAGAENVSDPVSTTSGNFTHTQPLLSYPSHIYGMDLTATYNSQSLTGSSLTWGRGWTTSLDMSFEYEAGSDVLFFRDVDGRVVPLDPDGQFAWEAPEGYLGTVVFTGEDPAEGGAYALQLLSGERFEFESANGQNYPSPPYDPPKAYLVRRCQGNVSWTASTGDCLDEDVQETGQVVTIVRAYDDWRSRVWSPVTVESSLGVEQTFVYDTDGWPHEDGYVYESGGFGRTVLFHRDSDTANTVFPAAISDPVLAAELTSHEFSFTKFERDANAAAPAVSIPGRLKSVGRVPANTLNKPSSSGFVPLASNTYDVRGRVLTQENEYGAVTTFNWDTEGQVTVTHDGAGESVVFSRDEAGRTVGLEDPSEKAASRLWGQEGDGSLLPVQPIQTTDRLGVSSGSYFDSEGRLTQVATPDPTPLPNGSNEGFLPAPYNDATPTACQRLPDGSFPTPNAETQFTRPNTQTATMNCTGRRFGRAIYTYLSGGGARVDTYTNAAGEVTKYLYTGSSPSPTKIMTGCVTYNSSNQTCSSGDAAVPSTSMTYDMSDDNLVLSTTDGTGVKTCYHHNAFGQVDFETPWVNGTCPTSAQTTSTVYTYTDLGQPATVDRPDPLGTWTYTYYGNGALKSVADSVGSDSVTFTYHSTGEVATTTDELGKVTSTTIDRKVPSETTCNGGISGSPGKDIDGNSVLIPCKVVTTSPPSGGPVGASKAIYDKAGRLRLSVAPGGGRSWQIYGTLGRVVKTVDPVGQVTQFAYDDNGRQTVAFSGTGSFSASSDAASSVVYDKAGRVLSRTTAKNNATKVTTAYSYDPLGRQIQQATPAAADGFVPSAAYDEASPTTCQRLPDGSFPKPKVNTTYTRPNGQSATMNCTDKAFGLTALEYGPTGVVKKTITYRSDSDWNAATEATVTPSYDAAGRQVCLDTRVMAQQSGVTETHYYTATDFDSGTGLAARTRTQLGSVSGCTDSPTDTTKWAISAVGYKANGSVAWQQNPLQYAAYPDPQQSDHPKWRVTFDYDAAGRRTKVTAPDPSNPGGGTVDALACYTARGELAMTIDPGQGVTKYGYGDQQGILLTVIDPTGMTYNSEPCSSTVKGGSDTHRGEVVYEYDSDGNRTVRKVYNDALSGQLTERWTYDAAARRTGYWDPLHTGSLSDPNTATEAVSYGLTSGRLVSRAVRTGDVSDSVDPTGSSKRVVTESYLPSGNVDAVVGLRSDSNGDEKDRVVTSRTYNPAGHVTAVQRVESHCTAQCDPDDSNASTWATDRDETLAFELTAQGAITKVTYPDDDFTAEYLWDLTGKPMQTKAPSGAWFRQVYDEGQRLESVDVAAYPTWYDIADYTRNALGQITGIDLGGTGGTRDYTFHNATAQMATYSQAAAVNKTNTVTYDTTGRIAQVCDATGSSGGVPACQSTDDRTTFDYDDAGQLTASTVKDAAGGSTLSSVAYTFGNRGNRATQAVFNGTNTTTTYYATHDDGRLCTETVGSSTPTCTDTTGATVTYTYDKAGRRITRAEGSTTRTFTYDPAGTLAKVAHTGGATDSQTLSVDPAGNLSKVNNSIGGDYDQLYWDHTLGLPQVMQWDANGLTATFAWGEERTSITGSGTWYAYDYLHSHIRTGGSIAPTGYTDYGKPTSTYSHTVAYTYRAEATLKSGLVYLRNRYYDPTTGTFLTRDAFDGRDGTATLVNPYHYADNDPLNRLDPTGLASISDEELLSFARGFGKMFEAHRPSLPGSQFDPGFLEFIESLGIHGWDDLRNAAGDLLRGTWDSLWSTGEAFVDMVRIGACNSPILSWTQDPAYCSEKLTMLSEMWDAVKANPWGVLVEVGKGLVNWDECAREGAYHCIGRFVPDLVICVLTSCVSASKKLFTDGINGLRRLLGKAKAFDIDDAMKAAKARRASQPAGATCSFSSFAASTAVLMANGTPKAIADVKVGDVVLATDPETGESGPREVVATLPHTDQLLTLRTSSGEIVTTEDHKYWNATDQAWQESQDLDTGDQLLTADGDEVTVEGLDWSTVHTDAAYDLTVADLHTFYVAAGDEAVLVHNCFDDFSPHALRQMAERGVTAEQVAAARARPGFSYWHDGQWKTGFWDPSSGVFLGRAADLNITTVMTNVDAAYVSRLKAARP